MSSSEGWKIRLKMSDEQDMEDETVSRCWREKRGRNGAV